MKTIKLIFTLLSLATFSAYAESPADPIAPMVKQKITALMNQNAIPGMAVELFVDGNLHQYYFGYANKATKEPVIDKTIFELGSISKIMTSILLAQEIDWAKMTLTDPITKYVPDLPAQFNKITLQDLATHTSGLPFSMPGQITTKENLQRYLKAWVPDTNPQNRWQYSNFGIGLLGFALENSTEREFSDLYRRHILYPLQMTTGAVVPPKLIQYYAQGYNAEGNATPPIEAGLFPAAYHVKASASDMQKFLSAAIGLPGTPPRVFYPMRLTESVFLQMGNEYQGLGWRIHPLEKTDVRALMNASDVSDTAPSTLRVKEILPHALYNGNALIDKTGSTNGFRAYIAVLPNEKSGIVLLANKNVPMTAVVKTARDILFTAVS